ncbi:hypothetical protein IW150_004753, partial [Coemansia sp. RSA 2607]
MSKEDKPRGLRARLRQRRARNSSEDEIKSRPTSLDLGRGPQPNISALGHSLTAVPTRSSGYGAHFRHNTFAASEPEEEHGLALGEFSEDAGEVVDGEQDARDPAVLRSVRSQDLRQVYPHAHVGTVGRRASRSSGRRVSSQSVPGVSSLRSDNDSAAYSVEQSLDETDAVVDEIPEEDEAASDGLRSAS